MAEMTLAEIEAEIARREGLDNDPLLTIGMRLFRQDPNKMIAESPSFVNKLLEVESKRLEIEASNHFSGDVKDYTNVQLQQHLYEGMQADDFWSMCENGINHLKTTKNYHDFDAFMQFLRSYVGSADG